MKKFINPTIEFELFEAASEITALSEFAGYAVADSSTAADEEIAYNDIKKLFDL